MLYIVLVIGALLIWLAIEMKNHKGWQTDGAAFTLCMMFGVVGIVFSSVALIVCTAIYSTYPDDLRSDYQWLVQQRKIDSLIIASGDLELLENIQTDDYFWSRARDYNAAVRFWRRHPNWSKMWGGWPDPAPYIVDYPLYEVPGDINDHSPSQREIIERLDLGHRMPDQLSPK
jgi:hypothetical protein